MNAKDLMLGDWYAFRGHPYQCTASDIASIAECEEKGAPTDISEIVDFVIKNYKPSFPTNLDEAAKEIATDILGKDYLSELDEDCAIDAINEAINLVKAGAEWMAGQGVTKEMVVTDTNGIIVSDTPLDLSGFRPYEKVIVQVRKK